MNKIKHIIITRFLSIDFNNGSKLFEKSFIEYFFNLLKNNFIKTLENQTNHNFEIIIVIHNDIDIKSLDMFNSLNTFLKFSLVRRKNLNNVIKTKLVGYDYGILSRFDCDDFIHKNVINDIQLKCDDNLIFMCYGYDNGYAYLTNEKKIVNFEQDYCQYGHFSCMQSFIINLNKIKIETITTPNDGKHRNQKNNIIKMLSQNNISFNDNMIVRDLSRKFIWFRHNNAGTTTSKGYKDLYINKKFLNREGLKVDKIKFNIDYGINL